MLPAIAPTASANFGPSVAITSRNSSAPRGWTPASLVRCDAAGKPVAKRRTRRCRTANRRRGRAFAHARSTVQVRASVAAQKTTRRAARLARFPRRDCCRPKTSRAWSYHPRRRDGYWPAAAYSTDRPSRGSKRSTRSLAMPPLHNSPLLSIKSTKRRQVDLRQQRRPKRVFAGNAAVIVRPRRASIAGRRIVLRAAVVPPAGPLHPSSRSLRSILSDLFPLARATPGLQAAAAIATSAPR
jgi:hypothetical protein